MVLSALLRVPHLYDMHSSLPQQLTNFAFSRSTLIRGVFLAIERLMVRRSRVVIVICPSLEETARAIDPEAQIVLIENAPGSAEEPATPDQAAACAIGHGLSLDDAAGALHGHLRGVSGARSAVCRDGASSSRTPRRAVAAGRRQTRSGDRAHARRPRRPASRMWRSSPANGPLPRFRHICSRPMCSCRRDRAAPTRRSRFINTCARAKPIVATRLLTHTQVLSDDTAILTGTSPAELAEGLLTALNDRTRAEAIGRRARELAETKYSYEAYSDRTRRACATLFAGTRTAGPLETVSPANPGNTVNRGSCEWRQGCRGPCVTGRADKNHYSYTHYADPETARTFDDRRFGGPIGGLIAATQAQAARGFGRACSGRDHSGRWHGNRTRRVAVRARRSHRHGC